VITAGHVDGCVTHFVPLLTVSSLLCIQVKQNLFPNDEVSSSTILMALKGAKQVSDLYPKELEQGCCMHTRDKHEYDTFNPNLIISVPSDRNADGSIDIIMSSRTGTVIRHTEEDDRIAWDDTSHSLDSGWLFPWEVLPREVTKGKVLEFVAEIANKRNLSLVDLTIFPMLVNHKSLTVRTSVCNMWSTYLDKVNQKESDPISHGCLQICNRIISEY
jgi:hypothetical protein